MKEKLKSIPYIGFFPDEALERLAELVSVERYAFGETVFAEGSEGNSLYLVESGEIEISKEGRTLSVMPAGSMFGEMALFETEERSASARARTDAVIYKINNSDFRSLIFEYSESGLKFLINTAKEISRRLRRTSEYFITIFDTGKIVGSELTLDEISAGLIGRLLRDLDATGGMMLIYNRFTGFYDLSYSEGCVILDADSAAEQAAAASGGRIEVSDEKGVVYGEPVFESVQVLGYMIFEKNASDMPFTSEQKIMISSVANQASLGILKAYTRQDEEARRRLEQGKMRGL